MSSINPLVELALGKFTEIPETRRVWNRYEVYLFTEQKDLTKSLLPVKYSHVSKLH